MINFSQKHPALTFIFIMFLWLLSDAIVEVSATVITRLIGYM